MMDHANVSTQPPRPGGFVVQLTPWGWKQRRLDPRQMRLVIVFYSSKCLISVFNSAKTYASDKNI